MVTFGGNNSDSTPFGYITSPDCRMQASLQGREFSRNEESLQEISVAWEKLLESASEVVSLSPAHVHRRNRASNDPNFAAIIISILNRCQLMRWMYEGHLENSNSSRNCTEYLARTKLSIEQDLVKLRLLLGDATAQSPYILSTTALANQLAMFFDRLCKCLI